MARFTPENTRGRMVRVFLNGSEIKAVCEADDALGFVVIMDRQAECGRRLLTGDVRVTFPESE